MQPNMHPELAHEYYVTPPVTVRREISNPAPRLSTTCSIH